MDAGLGFEKLAELPLLCRHGVHHLIRLSVRISFVTVALYLFFRVAGLRKCVSFNDCECGSLEVLVLAASSFAFLSNVKGLQW